MGLSRGECVHYRIAYRYGTLLLSLKLLGLQGRRAATRREAPDTLHNNKDDGAMDNNWELG